MKVRVGNLYTEVIEATQEERQKLYDILAYDVKEKERVRDAKIAQCEVNLWKAKTDSEILKWKSKMNWWRDWDGKIHLYDKYRRIFPSGLMYVVLGLFDDVKIESNLIPPSKKVIFPMKEPIILRSYQKDIVNEALELGARCVLHVATGAGKTQMGLYLASILQTTTLIIVPNTTVERQWLERIQRYFITSLDNELNVVKKVRLVTDLENNPLFVVATRSFVHNIYYGKSKTKSKEYERFRAIIDDCGLVIYDECHHASSKQSKEILESLNCYHRIGLTGTADMRSDGSDLVYHAYLGPNVGNLTQKDLIELEQAVKPSIKFIPVPPRNYPRSFNYDDIYENYIIQNEIRNNLIITEAIKLMRKKRKVLILTDRIAHCQRLKLQFSNFISAEDDLDEDDVVYTHSKDNKRNEKFNEFLYGNVSVMICTYQLVGEGFDFPDMNAMILAGSWKSKTRAIQSLGRLIRKAHEKSDAIFIDFANNTKYLWEHSRDRALAWYEAGFTIDVKNTFLENMININVDEEGDDYDD